ncbi:glycoside hydrolase family 18 protein [Paenibacillus sp. LHD-117]|uniref:glycoside hydrolase family 18 protein n=1 Tax=Paenibacillus sp. LHD-117 TaxID=3071412 RepID=UPI0027E050A2|nr:glycoside hydrolase family 18 protein [Paenibacillus sp. LHD-117]MDQ6420019.1 glycoside hydrolase family 18 protein [Paenibacillus sp. LHD-117]
MTNRNYIVAGYASDASLPHFTSEDGLKMTHLNVAFGHVLNDEIRIDHLKNLNALKVLKSNNPELKVLLSVGGWSAGGFSEAAATREGRQKMVSSAQRVLETQLFDGIDLDWEYPCYGEAGIQASPEDKYNFTHLLREMREGLDLIEGSTGQRYLLTIAAGADQYYIDGTEMGEVQKYLDFIQLMTYDMRGGFQTLTGHHTNLFTPSGDLFRISTDASVRMFEKAGVPRGKIVIGGAFYSRMWKDVPDRNRGLYQMTKLAGGYGPDYSALLAEYINLNGFTRYWDDEAKAPYLFDGSTFITYDDEESLTHKCEYIKNADLAGIMFWEYKCDTSHRLLDAIYTSLQTK